MVTGVTSRGMRDFGHNFGVSFLHEDVEEEKEKGGAWVGGIMTANEATPEHHWLVECTQTDTHIITLTACEPQLVTQVLHWTVLLQLNHKLVEVLRIQTDYGFYDI